MSQLAGGCPKLIFKSEIGLVDRKGHQKILTASLVSNINEKKMGKQANTSQNNRESQSEGKFGKAK